MKQCFLIFGMRPFRHTVEKGEFKGWANGIGKSLRRTGKRMFMPLRVALTGRASTYLQLNFS